MKEVNEMEVLTSEELDRETVYAKIIKKEDGYHVVDFDGTEGPVCDKRTSDGYIILTPNKANRKCYNEKNAEKLFSEGAECIELFYKPTRKIGPSGNRIPNEKLISYLPEAEQAEYKAIIERAKKARDDAKAKPMTELEKAQAKLERAKAALAKLQEEAANGNV